MKKTPLKTSLRSVTQATDSTRNGCRANSRRGKDTRPEPAGHLPQREKQQSRRNSVQHHIREMETAGTEPEELAVDHERQPRQRMPSARMAGSQRPRDALGAQPVRDPGIFIHVLVVVAVDELEPHRLSKNKSDGQEK